MFNTFKKNQLDFFLELENIGASHAATALSVMLGREISITVPHAKICDYKEISNALQGPENVVVGLLVGVSSDIDGFVLLVLDEKDAYSLTNSLMGGMEETSEEEGLSELQISALKEVSNILIGSYVNAISELTGLRIDVSVPDLVVDMAGAVMNLLATAYGDYSDTVLSLETQFVDNAYSVNGHFFLVPDIDSYQKLLEKMGVQ